MNLPSPPSLDPSILESNLSVVDAYLPVLADQLRSAEGPGSLSGVVARDGTPTYASEAEDGSIAWFGRTSMPTISAPALVDLFRPGAGNVVIFGIGHGAVLRLLCDRLPEHQAVLVLEPDPWKVAAALSLHDLTAQLSSRRVLIFSGPSAERQCAQFLADNAGFLLPDRVLSWPWFEPETVQQVQQKLTAVRGETLSKRALASAVSAEVASDLGRYSLDAFDFLHRGLDYTVQKIHGPQDPAMKQICEFLDAHEIDLSNIGEIDIPDSGLSHAIEQLGGMEELGRRLNRHVGGEELCWGLRDFALDQWGLLAPAVLRSWGIRSTSDFGRIVFALVENNHLQKQPEDGIEDFDDVYDFDSAFDQAYNISLPGSS